MCRTDSGHKTAYEAKTKIFMWPTYYAVILVFIPRDESEFMVPSILLPLGSFLSTALSESESK
jgi:hypothetical protein